MQNQVEVSNRDIDDDTTTYAQDNTEQVCVAIGLHL
jgi:hypothetical protein